MNEIVEKLAEESGGVLKKAYVDVVEPSAKPVGMKRSYYMLQTFVLIYAMLY